MTAEHVRTALDVRRGLKRLKDIPDTDRPHVSRALAITTDAQFAVMAGAQERRAPRASLTTPHRTRHARWQ